MTEFFVIFAGFSIIIGLPIAIMFYYNYRKECDDIKKISLDVKNSLTKKNSYSEISRETLVLVKASIIKKFILKTLVYAGVSFIYILLFVKREILLYFVAILAVALVLLTAKTIYEYRCISNPEKLTKIIGFVFRKKGYQLSIAYYDIQKLKYRVFYHNTFFSDADFAVPGKLVNLIGIRKKLGVHIIRLLSF